MRPIALGLASVLALPQTARSAPPEYDPEVPYEAQRPKLEYVEPQPPRGNAALGFGIVGLTFGVSLIPPGILLVGGLDASFPGLMTMGIGLGLVGLGTAGIVVGKRRRAAWKAWASTKGPDPQSRTKPGTPQLIIGTTTIVLGTATLIPAAIVLDWISSAWTVPGGYYEASDLALPIFMTAWAGTSVITGIALVADGGVRRRGHHESERHRAGLSPSGWATRGSFGFGVAGRF